MTRTGITAAAIGAALFAAALPAIAAAQDYDGYCYQKKKDAGTGGAVVGAIIGGAIGSQISKNERGLGTVGGAIIGGSIGAKAGRDSVKCYNGDYYAYDSGYYTPPPPPDGYTVVYYRSRPSHDYYDNVRTRQAYNEGYRDGYRQSDRDDDRYARSYSYRDEPRGWYDEDGDWHQSRPNREKNGW